jgi:hypothetical protein
MKMFIRNALLGAAGLVALSLPAHAAGSTTVGDAPLFKSSTNQQLAQRPYDPSAGTVGYKRSTPQQQAQRPYDPSAGSVGFRNENPGGVGFKKAKK